MTTPILDQNRAYRKGLILGFTMAEISMLIIFCLLIATSFIVQQKDHTINKLAHENNRLIEIKKILNKLINNSTEHNKFDDLFQELKRVEAQANKSKQLQEELNSALQEVNKLQKIKSMLVGKDQTEKSSEAIANEILTESTYAKELKNSIQNTKFQNSSPQEIAETLKSSEELAKVIVERTEANIEMERLKGQLANAQKKLVGLGKGTEMPACWADPNTGKPEYIFKIDLSSSGLVIHDLKLPHRTNEQKQLPLNRIPFEQVLNQNSFLSQTLPLSKWSIEHNCRFFVKVNDSTEANQKNIYKSMLRTLESHFYKFETT